MPYAPFSEYLEAYLRHEKLSPAQLARSIAYRGHTISEETVAGWLRGVQPGLQLHDRIEEVIGYRFDQRTYDLALEQTAQTWPDGTRERFPEIEKINTAETLRDLLKKSKWMPSGLSAFFGFPTRQGLTRFLSGKPLDTGGYLRILRRLPDLLSIQSGEALSIHCPAPLLIEKLTSIRREKGLDVRSCATKIGIKHDTLRIMESESGTRTYFKDFAHAERIGRFLAASGVKIIEYPDVTKDTTVASSSAPSRSEGDPPTDWAEKIREYQQMHTLRLATLARSLGCSSRTIQRVLKGEQQPSAALRERIAGLAGSPEPRPDVSPEKPDVVEALRNELRAITARVAALEGNSAVEHTLSGVHHTLRTETFPDIKGLQSTEIAHVKKAIEEARRLLNRCAAITDQTLRAEIREALQHEVDELVITLLAFGRDFPFALLPNLERMREWTDRFYQDEQKKG